MSRSAKAEAVLALHRFGMGPRPGSIAAIEADPRGALIAELERPSASQLAASALPSSSKAFRTVNEANAKRQAKTIIAAKAVPDPGRQIYLDEARVRTEAAFGAEIGFVERLVWFWSNHFCISADKIQS